MRRGISSTACLVASLAAKHQDKAIWAAGGFAAPAQPNRELRRRMARDARQQAKRAARTKATP